MGCGVVGECPRSTRAGDEEGRKGGLEEKKRSINMQLARLSHESYEPKRIQKDGGIVLVILYPPVYTSLSISSLLISCLV